MMVEIPRQREAAVRNQPAQNLVGLDPQAADLVQTAQLELQDRGAVQGGPLQQVTRTRAPDFDAPFPEEDRVAQG